MPVSKHRRNNKTRPRPKQIEAAQAIRIPPSPAWVPIVGVSLLIIGVLIILVGYFVSFTDGWPLFNQNWPLVIGFTLLSVGFGFLMNWR